MNRAEAAQILTKASVFDGRDPSSKVAATAWAEALHDVPADADAFAAVSRFYGTPPENGDRRKWLEPHHLRAVRQQIRFERIPDGTFTYPPPSGSETGAEFVERRRQQISAIADGRINAEPIRQLQGGPHPTVADALNGIGRMPAHLRDELAAVGLGRRTGLFPELAIACPLEMCRAAPGKPCKRPSGKEIKTDTHGSRRDAYAHRPAA